MDLDTEKIVLFMIPINLIAFKDGWIANYDYLVFYDSVFKEKNRIQVTRIDTGYIKATSTTIVKNGNAILLTGNCKACNPYDDNSNSRYDRPTAIMIDSNFKDYGKAQAPIVPPVPYDKVNLFPNPSSENITLQITAIQGIYDIYNSCGKLIKSGSMQTSTNINIANLSQGMYIINIKTPQGDNIGSVKFMKKE
ncbi:MAG: T9SS type A sorting domain-containing protein [Bacteroidetes bacterium]|nr:T9SS type A sorting domain-containing protein [Bacteroidota bacterium]